MSEQWKLCSNCGNVPMATSNHTILCNTCHRELLPEIWQSRPLEDALRARAEEAEEDSESLRHYVRELQAERDQVKAMVERLIEAGNGMFEDDISELDCAILCENWHALAKEWKKGQK